MRILPTPTKCIQNQKTHSPVKNRINPIIKKAGWRAKRVVVLQTLKQDKRLLVGGGSSRTVLWSDKIPYFIRLGLYRFRITSPLSLTAFHSSNLRGQSLGPGVGRGKGLGLIGGSCVVSKWHTAWSGGVGWNCKSGIHCNGLCCVRCRG